jgi:hypothetical protein
MLAIVFEVLTALAMRNSIFWDITVYNATSWNVVGLIPYEFIDFSN